MNFYPKSLWSYVAETFLAPQLHSEISKESCFWSDITASPDGPAPILFKGPYYNSTVTIDITYVLRIFQRSSLWLLLHLCSLTRLKVNVWPWDSNEFFPNPDGPTSFYKHRWIIENIVRNDPNFYKSPTWSTCGKGSWFFSVIHVMPYYWSAIHESQRRII